ncbi:jg2294 [Pararge aegeria aegeria]|uniref:Jg2294 protein n=1 Tax=Pararge aegeria aegeria TaxID=348720 RepID=A0A8S4QD92_9NEOP|nr:jg2294 [Pararge aegeria aegeria]
MASWIEDLRGCYLILYRASGSLNQSALFGKNSPLTREDPRVRALPFPTRKPTYKEVKRVHETVASVEVYGEILTRIICTYWMLGVLHQRLLIELKTKLYSQKSYSLFCFAIGLNLWFGEKQYPDD